MPETVIPLRLQGRLAAPFTVGREALVRLGLRTEAPTLLTDPALDGLADLIVSAHAPFSEGGVRLNIASPERDRRTRSLDTIKRYMEQVRKFPKVKKIVCHAAPKIWHAKDGALEQTGEYVLLIEGLQELADLAAAQGWGLVMENNRAYYHTEFPKCPGAPGGASENFYIGTAPEEWRQIAKDVRRDNFGLCLDTSHACTFAHLLPAERRASALMRYVAEPGLIAHIHWSDNLLYDEGGRQDAHLAVGEGTLPMELHRALLGAEATILLEHFYDLARLEREIQFISRL